MAGVAVVSFDSSQIMSSRKIKEASRTTDH
jgi:hypothetical protein